MQLRLQKQQLLANNNINNFDVPGRAIRYSERRSHAAPPTDEDRYNAQVQQGFVKKRMENFQTELGLSLIVSIGIGITILVDKSGNNTC